MNTITRRAAQFAAALCFGLAAVVAPASPIVLDQWYTFGFAGAGPDPLISGAGFSLGIRSVAAPDPSWDFVCAGSCTLTVTDGFLAVDRFEIFDGASLGMTSPPSGDATHTCANDELVCLADPQMSHGIFNLAAGAHSITGTHLFDRPGAGFFIVTAVVPEPAPLLLLGVGLLALLGMRRRR